MTDANNQALITFVNGEIEGVVSIFDRGLSYGDGVFETIFCKNGNATLWSLHLDRLCLGLARLNIMVEASIIEAYKDQLLTKVLADGLETQGLLKLIVTRGVGYRGYAPAGSTTPTVILAWFAKPVFSAHCAEYGVTASLCSTKLSRNTQLAGIKHLNRLEQVLAAQELQASNIDEGLLLDTENNLIEAVSKNIFLIKKDTLYTPQLTYCGVKGVMREYIINTIAPTLNIALIEQNIPVGQLADFDEAFVCNSVHGLWPLKSIGDNKLCLGSISKSIQSEVDKCLS
jgi:4-amino-4-deoxychorismate lyase